MPGENKKRTVETEFKVRDSFSGGVGNMTSKLTEASKKANELREKFRDFRREQGLTTLGALGLGYGIGSWVEKTREVNREFAATQKGIAGVLSSSLKFEKGASEIDRYNRSLVLSKGITEELEEAAARFNVNLTETDQSYRVLSSAAANLGLTQKQVMELNLSSIATAKRFGADGERAALTIARALQTGTVRGVEPFDNKLRQVVGNMHKLTSAQRFQHIQQALRGSMQVADAMSTGIDASLNRAQTTVSSLLRQATGPLFGEVAKDLDKWSKHLHEMRENGKPLIDVFSGKLVGAFHAIETASGFIKDHWVAIAGLNIGSKLMGNAGKMAGMFGGGIGGGAEGGVGAVSTGLGAMASKLGLVTGGLSAFWMAEEAVIGLVEGYLDKSRGKDERAGMGMGSLQTMMKLAGQKSYLGVEGEAKRDAMARRTVDELKKYGLVNGNGKLDRGGLMDAVTRMGGSERETLANQLGIRNKNLPVSQMSASQFAEPLMRQMSSIIDQYGKAAAIVTKKATDDKSLPFAKGNTIINGNINVQMKVEDEDPDRVFTRFTQKLQGAISRRGQAVNAEPEGL